MFELSSGIADRSAGVGREENSLANICTVDWLFWIVGSLEVP